MKKCYKHYCNIYNYDMNLSIKEKEKYVIELRKQGKTYREIAHELLISPREIHKILEKAERSEEEAKEKERKKMSPSNTTEALKLYKEGKSPIDVAILLDIPPEEAKTIWLNYLSLQNLGNLITLYQELNKQQHAFDAFSDLYYYTQEKNISKEEIVELNKMKTALPKIREEFNNISDQLINLKIQRDGREAYNKYLQTKNYEFKEEYKSHLGTIDSKKDELHSIDNELDDKKQLLENMNKSDEYNNLKSNIEKEIDKYLSQKKNFIKLAFETILKFMKKDNDTKYLVNNILYTPNPFIDHYIDYYKNKIVEMADTLYDDIVKIITYKTINS